MTIYCEPKLTCSSVFVFGKLQMHKCVRNRVSFSMTHPVCLSRAAKIVSENQLQVYLQHEGYFSVEIAPNECVSTYTSQAVNLPGMPFQTIFLERTRMNE